MASSQDALMDKRKWSIVCLLLLLYVTHRIKIEPLSVDCFQEINSNVWEKTKKINRN